MSVKKKQQLGMNPSTASARLIKDLLWSFVEELDRNKCHVCKLPMTRESFSIEHMEPWLDSKDPIGLFFDLNNISFSHLSCNVRTRRLRKIKYNCGTRAKYRQGCRCIECKKVESQRCKNRYTKEARQDRYIRLGK